MVFKRFLQNYREVDAKFPRICQFQSDFEKGIDILKPYSWALNIDLSVLW